MSNSPPPKKGIREPLTCDTCTFFSEVFFKKAHVPWRDLVVTDFYQFKKEVPPSQSRDIWTAPYITRRSLWNIFYLNKTKTKKNVTNCAPLFSLNFGGRAVRLATRQKIPLFYEKMMLTKNTSKKRLKNHVPLPFPPVKTNMLTLGLFFFGRLGGLGEAKNSL